MYTNIAFEQVTYVQFLILMVNCFFFNFDISINYLSLNVMINIIKTCNAHEYSLLTNIRLLNYMIKRRVQHVFVSYD